MTARARPFELAGVTLLALLATLIGWQLAAPLAESFLADNRLILTAYAAHLRAGEGLVFNAGERALLIPAPLYMILVAFVEPAWLFALSAALAVGSLFSLTLRMGGTRATGLLVAGLYVLAWPLWSGMGTAFPLMSGLCLLAFERAAAARWRVVGISLALAALCGPEALLVALPLLGFAVSTTTPGAGARFAQGLLIPLTLSGAGLVAYYGPSLWEGLIALRRSVPTWFDTLSWPYLLVLVPVAAWAWYRGHSHPITALCGAWIALYAGVLGGLLRIPNGWQYLPLVGPAALLAGLRFQRHPITGLMVAFGVVMGVASIGAIAITRDSSALRPELPAAYRFPANVTSIGVPTVADALRVERMPGQTVIAFDGQLQPALRRMLERGDWRSALVRYAPDMFRLPAANPWDEVLLARLDYRPDAAPGMLRLRMPLGPFAPSSAAPDEPMNISFGPHIRLTGMALDRVSVEPGGVVRIRLDWMLARSATTPVSVDLRLADAQGLAEDIRDEIAPGVLREGAWSTYHALVVPPSSLPGEARLTLGVRVGSGLIARIDLASLTVVGR